MATKKRIMAWWKKRTKEKVKELRPSPESHEARVQKDKDEVKDYLKYN